MSAKSREQRTAPNILLDVMAPLLLVERSLDKLSERKQLTSDQSLLVEGMCLTLRRALADLQRAYNHQQRLEFQRSEGGPK